MWQNGAMWNVAEGGYVELDRRGLCGMGQKGAMQIVAQSA